MEAIEKDSSRVLRVGGWGMGFLNTQRPEEWWEVVKEGSRRGIKI